LKRVGTNRADPNLVTKKRARHKFAARFESHPMKNGSRAFIPTAAIKKTQDYFIGE
jgi:hypothetical protein